MMFHYFGFHYVTCPQPLNMPCACGTFKKPMSNIGSVGSLVIYFHSANHDADRRPLVVIDLGAFTGFLPRIFQGISCYANLCCYANFSIVFGPTA